MDYDKIKLQIALVIMLVALGVINLGIGMPDAIKEYGRAKACTVKTTAVKDPDKSEERADYGGRGNVRYIEHTFVYIYDGKEYGLRKVIADYGLAPSADEIKICIDPDNPNNYVMENDRYADVDNIYIKVGGIALVSAAVLGLLYKISNKDFV